MVNDQEDQARGSFTIEQPPDPWARLPEIAARLGVKPCESAGMMIVVRDGGRYDVFDLVNALLDRVDAAIAAQQ